MKVAKNVSQNHHITITNDISPNKNKHNTENIPDIKNKKKRNLKPAVR